jgi:hemoglobin
MSDIKNTEDITQLMTKFYVVMLANPTTAPVFAEIDMQTHMPRIVSFWESMILGGGGYTGSPFEPHIPLNLTTEHFEIWYETFCSCLDADYAGPNVDMLKHRAHSIAYIFCHKLGLDAPTLQ